MNNNKWKKTKIKIHLKKIANKMQNKVQMIKLVNILMEKKMFPNQTKNKSIVMSERKEHPILLKAELSMMESGKEV